MAVRILVVDDAINLALVSEVMQAAQFEVHRAESAAQALMTLSALIPEIMLIDMSLPGLDGLALIRQVRADPSLENLNIVALTALDAQDDHQAVLDAGCDELLVKPIDTRLLLDVLGRVINEKGRDCRSSRASPDRGERGEPTITTLLHDLRSSLNGVVGFSELLRDEGAGPLNEKQKKFVSFILLSATRMLRDIDVAAANAVNALER